jgi:hypothetical protein
MKTRNQPLLGSVMKQHNTSPTHLTEFVRVSGIKKPLLQMLSWPDATGILHDIFVL